MTTTEADAKPGDAPPVLTLTIPLPELARTIRARLGYLGRTATWLAAEVGLSPTSVSHRMSGRIAWAIDELHRVAAALDLDLRELAPTLGATLQHVVQADDVTPEQVPA